VFSLQVAVRALFTFISRRPHFQTSVTKVLKLNSYYQARNVGFESLQTPWNPSFLSCVPKISLGCQSDPEGIGAIQALSRLHASSTAMSSSTVPPPVMTGPATPFQGGSQRKTCISLSRTPFRRLLKLETAQYLRLSSSWHAQDGRISVSPARCTCTSSTYSAGIWALTQGPDRRQDVLFMETDLWERHIRLERL
jgi:hypothetical protein